MLVQHEGGSSIDISRCCDDELRRSVGWMHLMKVSASAYGPSLMARLQDMAVMLDSLSSVRFFFFFGGGGLYTARARAQPPPPPRLGRAPGSNEPGGPRCSTRRRKQSRGPHRSRRQPTPLGMDLTAWFGPQGVFSSDEAAHIFGPGSVSFPVPRRASQPSPSYA
jgi:hypothetical protein